MTFTNALAGQTGGEDKFLVDHEKFLLFQEDLKKRYGEAVYQSWFADLLLDSVSADAVIFSTVSPFKADAISQRFKSYMKAAWVKKVSPINTLSIVARKQLSAHAAKINGLEDKGAREPAMRAALPNGAASKNGAGLHAGRSDKLGYTLFGDAKSHGGRSKQREPRKAPTLGELASGLNPNLTFNSFALDDSNRVAHAAARQIFVDAAPAEFVYIYGPSGIGKTHLLNAICNEWRRRGGADGCAYFTYNNMVSGCSSAVLSNSILALHQDMLKQNLIAIDDIHLLAGKTRTEEEILNLVNAFAGSGRRLVIVGEMAPARLAASGMNERLADRLAGGLCVPITTASDALRFEVLKKRISSARPRCHINDGAIEYVAKNFPQSMRAAIGALNQLLLIHGGEDVMIGAEEARVCLASRVSDRPRKPASLDETLKATADAFSLTVGDLKGRAQPQRIVRGRHAFVFVCRENLKESFPSIARTIDRDHTTAMSGYKRAQDLIAREDKFRNAVADIRVAIGA